MFLPETASDVCNVLRSNATSAHPSPIVARGGGTGTNGQSLTNGLMIDLKRNLNSIIEIDVHARTAVVEPGVVAGELNSKLAAHDLFWAPHTSSINRATVGGMIATDAAGKGSLVHGRANRHVLALDVCLADGTQFRAEPMSIADAEKRAEHDDRVGEIWRALLDLDIAETDTFDLPELARGFSGYGIDRLRRDGMIDPLALLVGAEGTLGITTRATIRLSPIPEHTTLVVAAYRSFADALDDALVMRETRPSAIESFDERTLSAGRNSPAWSALGDVVGDHNGSVLLIEYDGSAPVDDAPIHASLKESGRAIASKTVHSPGERTKAWKVRADAVGLLAKVEVGAPQRSARPTAMVEDCAVPVKAMPAFIADYRACLDSFGIEYGMYGHADVGCVHVRPALDTSDPEHEALVRTITDGVVAVVKKHGGVLWGEHGQGFRGEAASQFLSPETIDVMRQVKEIFDPHDLLNPGKLYRPASSDLHVTAVDAAPMRGQHNRTVPVTIRRDFDDAFACNGNGLCQHYSASEVMCPSYKATRDPALSPKGRADLLRSHLMRREAGGDADFDDAVADNLHQCLSCSACSGHCPVEVNIPELKSRFLDHYYESRRRPLAHQVLSRFESLASVAAVSPTAARVGAGPLGRLLGLVDLPMPTGKAKKSAFATFDAGNSSADVVLLRDVFTGRLEPETLEKSARVLTSLGLRVELSAFVPSGKFDHVKGRRSRFAEAANNQAHLIESITEAGAVPVAIEPATALLHNLEYPSIHPSYPGSVRHLADVLHDHIDTIAASAPVASARGQHVSLLGHCTERATRPKSLTRWAAVLTAVGFSVDVPALGCCGMAGIFGHEADNQQMSKDIWELSWAGAVQSSNTAVATGFSCRSQTHRMTKSLIEHPIHLL